MAADRLRRGNGLFPEELDLVFRLVEKNRGPIDPVYRSMIELLNDNEGFTTYLYRDTLGNPTIGLGMLETPDRKYDYLQTRYPAGPYAVPRSVVEEELRELKRRAFGRKHPAKEFVSATGIGWTHEQGVNVALDKLAANHQRLLSQFPEFDSYP